MTEPRRVEKQLETIFEEELGLQPPSPDTDLFGSGTMDSLTFVNLLACIERKFGFTIQLESVELENFQSIARIARFVAERGGGAGVHASGDENHAQDKYAAG